MIPRLSVNRPVAVLMVILIIIILGLVAVVRMPVDLFPKLDFPIAVVMTSYSGAGPEEVESLVTKPIEEAMSSVNNVKSVTSQSQEGFSMVMVEFAYGTDLDFATLQMRERLDQVRPFLPDDADAPGVLKFDPSLIPIMALGISGADDPAQMRALAEDLVAPRLERVPGVAAVSVQGGLEREVKVRLDPQRLQAFGLSPEQVIQTLQIQNRSLPGGNIRRGDSELVVRTTSEFKSVEEIRDLPVPLPGAAGFVRIGDLGEVVDGYKDTDQTTRLNGRSSVGIAIQKQSEANPVEVSRAIRAELDRIGTELPQGFDVVVILDQAEFIEESIATVVEHAVVGAIFAVVILFLFLRSVRGTLVISTAIPISILGAFVLMFFSGVGLNLISLGGLALAIGRFVDDSIVALENIYRHREMGKSRAQAAIDGVNEVAGAITGSTLTVVAVFLPVVFVEGFAAQLFRDMSLTVSFGLLASLVVALTVVPLVSSRILDVVDEPAVAAGRRPGLIKRALAGFGEAFRRTEERYSRFIRWSLGHRRWVIGVSAAALVGSFALAPFLGTAFMAELDQGQFTIDVTLPKGTASEVTDQVVAEVEALVRAIPEVEDVYAQSGATEDTAFTGAGSSHRGQVRVVLAPATERSRPTEAVVEEMREKVQGIPGAEFTVQASSAFGGGFTGAPVQIQVKGDDFATLRQLSDEAVRRVAAVEGTREVESSLEEGRPEVRILVDRDKALTLGLSPSQIAQSVRTALSGQVATQLRVDGEETDIRVQLPEPAREDLTDLLQLPVATPEGGTVPLGGLARIETEEGPVTIDREDKVRLASITADIVGRDLGSVMRDIQASLAEMQLPPGYSIEYGGQDEQMMESFAALGFAFILAVILVYMVMAAQFESLIHPFTIMMTLPLGLIGVILSLLVTGRPLDISAFIGIIMFVGIIVANGIVLIDYVQQLRQRGVERNEALMQAGARRLLRPILMTALATIFALLPLAFGAGAGAESQAPMATVVVGGLVVGTFLTLVVIPVLYTLMDDLSRRFTRRGRRSGLAAGEGEVPAGGPAGV